MSIVYKIMDGNLCYSNYDSKESAQAELKKLRNELQDLVNVAQQDLDDFDETMSIKEES